LKTTIKLSMVAAFLMGTCAVADTKLTTSGDAEISYKSIESAGETNKLISTEVNLNIDAALADGVGLHTSFVVFDGVQADSSAGADNTANMATTYAYVTMPVLDSKGMVKAGLSPDDAFGTGAFENGGESWKTAFSYAISDSLKVSISDKKIKEMQADDSVGDSDEMAVALTGNIDGIALGLKSASKVTDKDAATEESTSFTNLFVSGEYTGFGYGFEYKANGGDADGSGIYLEASKTFDKLSTSLEYVTLTEGISAGDDFAPGEFFDGNVASSATKDTSAIVVGLGYPITETVGLSATLISAEVLEKSATEMILSASYAYSDATSILATYANATGDGVGTDDESVMKVTIETSF
jgi:hypothetical protein